MGWSRSMWRWVALDLALTLVSGCAHTVRVLTVGVGHDERTMGMEDKYLWDHTEFPTVIEGRFMANWVYLGEGRDGEYDPNDPDDMALLRFDTYEWGDGDWEPIDGGTYCTGMPVGTDRNTLVWVLERIVADLHACVDSPRRMLEGWSWVNPLWAEVTA